jgi:hypothetical protein
MKKNGMIFAEKKLAEPAFPLILEHTSLVHTCNLVNVNLKFGFFATFFRMPFTLHRLLVSFPMFSAIYNIFDAAILEILCTKQHFTENSNYSERTVHDSIRSSLLTLSLSYKCKVKSGE